MPNSQTHCFKMSKNTLSQKFTPFCPKNLQTNSPQLSNTRLKSHHTPCPKIIYHLSVAKMPCAVPIFLKFQNGMPNSQTSLTWLSVSQFSLESPPLMRKWHFHSDVNNEGLEDSERKKKKSHVLRIFLSLGRSSESGRKRGQCRFRSGLKGFCSGVYHSMNLPTWYNWA